MAVYDYVTGTVDLARRQANRIVSPDDRQKAYDSVIVFANDRSLLFVGYLTSSPNLCHPICYYSSTRRCE